MLSGLEVNICFYSIEKGNYIGVRDFFEKIPLTSVIFLQELLKAK